MPPPPPAATPCYASIVDESVKPLTGHLRPPGSGAAFSATREGGFALLTPLTRPAELADAIIAARFDFERDALSN